MKGLLRPEKAAKFKIYMAKLKHTIRGYHRQHGQTMVFALVFIVVILIGVVVLFNTGQLTRHKMEVQNAADAGAYSVAVLTARQLNFMAYTNRAMVANQVSVGQFSAFRSWGKKFEMAAAGPPLPNKPYFRTTGYLSIMGLNAIAPGAGAAVAISVWGTTSIYNVVYQAVGAAMGFINTLAVSKLPELQNIYLFHNYIMQAATQVAQVELLPKVIEANAEDAKLSNFGALAVLLSATEQQMNFLYSPKPKIDKGKQAKRRFAAFVNDSRDTWTKNRVRRDLRSPEIPLIPLPGGGVSASMGFDLRGGTELRFITIPDKKELYNWSSLDTVGLGLDVRIKASFCAIWEPYVASWTPFRIKWRCAWRIKVNNTYPLNLPMGGASYEVIEASGLLGPFISQWGTPQDSLYGNALINTYPSAMEATVPVPGGYQPPANFSKGLPRYIDLDAENYPAVKEAPVFLVSVRKNANDLGTSDRINKSSDVLTTGEFEVKTRLAGGDNSTEGDPGGRIGQEIQSYINDVVAKYKQRLLDATGGLGGGLATAAANQFKTELNKILNSMGNTFNNLLIPNSSNQQDGAIFAMAAASVYFANPDARDENGSTFTPYWQVRLKPVDDNIRKWSVLTQTLSADTSTQAELQYTDPDPDTSGVRSGSELMRLEKVVPK